MIMPMITGNDTNDDEDDDTMVMMIMIYNDNSKYQSNIIIQYFSILTLHRVMI